VIGSHLEEVRLLKDKSQRGSVELRVSEEDVRSWGSWTGMLRRKIDSNLQALLKG